MAGQTVLGLAGQEVRVDGFTAVGRGWTGMEVLRRLAGTSGNAWLLPALGGLRGSDSHLASLLAPGSCHSPRCWGVDRACRHPVHHPVSGPALC